MVSPGAGASGAVGSAGAAGAGGSSAVAGGATSTGTTAAAATASASSRGERTGGTEGLQARGAGPLIGRSGRWVQAGAQSRARTPRLRVTARPASTRTPRPATAAAGVVQSAWETVRTAAGTGSI